jgi:hypothetical protein
MATEQRPRPADTQEFLALWNAAKEEHFVEELAPLLPLLLGSPRRPDGEHTREAARHLVRALHLASTSEGGLSAAMDYLTTVVEGKGSAT